MLVPELKSSYRHPPRPKELGETEVKLRHHIEAQTDDCEIYKDITAYENIGVLLA